MLHSFRWEPLPPSCQCRSRHLYCDVLGLSLGHVVLTLMHFDALFSEAKDRQLQI